MANTKEVHIEVIVPFDWASNLTAGEAKVWAAWMLGPHGLVVEYSSAPSVPSENGGIVTRYTLHVEGIEATWESTLAIMVESLRNQRHAEIVAAEYRDLDDPSGWFTIRTPDEVETARVAVEKHMDELMRDKHWVTTEIAPGFTEERLVPDES